MNIITPGLHYQIETTNGELIDIRFCNKDENGQFQHGFTSEELIKVMNHRFNTLAQQKNNTCNIRCSIYMQQTMLELVNRQNSKDKNKVNGN